jgi:hypothetical protein
LSASTGPSKKLLATKLRDRLLRNRSLVLR